MTTAQKILSTIAAGIIVVAIGGLEPLYSELKVNTQRNTEDERYNRLSDDIDKRVTTLEANHDNLQKQVDKLEDNNRRRAVF